MNIVGTFWSFLRVLPFRPIHIFLFQFPLHIFSCCHSFISCHPWPHSRLGKIFFCRLTSIVIPVGEVGEAGIAPCALHWTLSLAEHSLGQNVSEITDQNFSVQSPFYYWQKSLGGIGNAMDRPFYTGMTTQPLPAINSSDSNQIQSNRGD